MAPLSTMAALTQRQTSITPMAKPCLAKTMNLMMNTMRATQAMQVRRGMRIGVDTPGRGAWVLLIACPVLCARKEQNCCTYPAASRQLFL